MARIRGILFDFGDTLLDFGTVDTIDLFEQGARGTYAYLQRKGFKLPPFGEYHSRQLKAVRRAYAWSHVVRREFNALDVIGKLARRMGHRLEQEDLDEIAWQWYQPLAAKGTLEEGTVQMLRQFTADGLTLAVVSNTFIPGGVLDRHLRDLGLLELFPVRLYSCDVRYRKPHRRIFRLALQRAGLTACEALFVGDTPRADILGARRAGMLAVLKDPHGHHAASRIRPDYTVRSLLELPGILEQLNAAPR
ncbi:MAG: HAD family hydrolase [Planctomycetes bacterium]|nr:HAD family hydrolase [Planctomycetota bacterium]